MSAAAVRFIDRWRFDDRVFSGGDRRPRRQRSSAAHRPRERQGGSPPQRRPAARRGGAGGRNARCSPSGRRCRSTMSEHELIAGAGYALLQDAAGAPTPARCSSNHFWWSSFGLVAAVLVIAAIAMSYADSYGAERAWNFRRHVHPAHPDHGRRRHDAQRLAPGRQRRQVGASCRLSVWSRLRSRLGVGILSFNVGLGPAILPALVPSRAGGVRLARLFLAAGADPGRPAGHGPDRRLQAVPQRRRGGSAGISSTRRKRRRSCSSASCPMPSRSMSRTPGPSGSPACWRRPASAPRCRPGTPATP